MAQELRQRRTSPSPPLTSMTNGPSSSHARKGGLTLSALLQASPQEHGAVQKLRVPLLYSILPYFLQTWICRVPFLAQFLAPRWEPRYLILVGSYLYKFAANRMNREEEDEMPQEPKGSPLYLEEMQVDMMMEHNLSSDDIHIDDASLPLGYKAIFCVSTFRKKYYYAVDNRESALSWVHSLQEAKQEALRRSMGHAHKDSYPNSWTYYDQLGKSLRNRKERIRQRLEQQSLKELEMSQIADVGPIPRGYYG